MLRAAIKPPVRFRRGGVAGAQLNESAEGGHLCFGNAAKLFHSSAGATTGNLSVLTNGFSCKVIVVFPCKVIVTLPAK